MRPVLALPYSGQGLLILGAVPKLAPTTDSFLPFAVSNSCLMSIMPTSEQVGGAGEEEPQ